MFTFSDLVSLITATYLVLFLVVAGVVAWLVRSWVWKVLGLAVVCAVFAVPLIRSHAEETKRIAHNRMIAERFAQLCKEKAGEKIFRTVEGVEGFLIMRPRKPTKDHKEYLDQFWMGDPYGHSDLEAENPEHVFLSDRRGFEGTGITVDPIKGYDFIELPSGESQSTGRGEYLKITVTSRKADAEGRQHIEYERTFRDTPQSRYGLTWEDVSTPEDRNYWIAGGRLRIIELSSNIILAERTGYVIDREQGARVAQGIPWLLAQRNACPPFQSDTTKAKEFVSKALKPSRETNSGK